MNKKPLQRKMVLGRGLSALIPTGPELEETIIADRAAPENEIVELDWNKIATNPYQPRKEFKLEEIQSLAESIKNHGLMQPVLVRQKSDSAYEIISGERRFRALRSLGRETISCVVRKQITDREMMEMALVENLQREDLNEIEKAEAYQRLLLDHNYSHEELAARVGKSRTAISNSLRLLNLPVEIKEMVRDKSISMGHARALLALEDGAKQIEMAKRVVTENLSVRAIEKETQAVVVITKPKKIKPGADSQPTDPDTTSLIEKLRYKFGTQVAIKKRGADRGTLEIDYFSENDFSRIIDLLLTDK